MTKTSHVRNRPFDFKLIDLVEPNQVLYRRQKGLSNYQVMKLKNEVWMSIAQDMNCSAEFCLMRWNNLRGQFQKEFRRCHEICPKEGIVRGSTWPYLQRLKFLEDTLQCNRPKIVREPKRKRSETSKPEYDVVVETNEYFECISPSEQVLLPVCKKHVYEANIEQLKTVFNKNDILNNMIIEVDHQPQMPQQNQQQHDEQQQQQQQQQEEEEEVEDEAEQQQLQEQQLFEAMTEDELISESDGIEVEGLSDMQSPTFGTECLTDLGVFQTTEVVSHEVVTTPQMADRSVANMTKIAQFLVGFEGEKRRRIERRIMAFLCRCQLRALYNQNVDDLEV